MPLPAEVPEGQELQKRNDVEHLFVLALAELGLRNTKRAKDLLNQVLSLDCNHLAAQLEQQALTRVSDAATVVIAGSFHTVGDAMARLQVSPLAP